MSLIVFPKNNVNNIQHILRKNRGYHLFYTTNPKRRFLMSRYQVPQDNRRACLCRDGSYSTKCCNADDYFAQGIGSIHKGETDSAGTITEIDTQETISSTSTTPTSQGSSTLIEVNTIQTYTSSSSEEENQDTPGTISSFDFVILTSIQGSTPASFSFTYNETTYTRGMVDDSTEITDYDDVSVTGWGTNPIQFDTDTIQVGSFVADGYGTFINSDDTHISSFGPYVAYSTPKYFRADFDTVAVFGNPLDAYPIYKVEQSNGYLKVTEIITS